MGNFRGTSIDQFVISLADNYARLFNSAINTKADHKLAGIEAAKKCSAGPAFDKLEISLAPGEPITGVTGLRGGQTRFDKLYFIGGVEVWLELQSSDYGGSRKDAQLQGQIIALGESIATDSSAAFFYKVLAKERKIFRWSQKEAEAAVQTGNYHPPNVYDF